MAVLEVVNEACQFMNPSKTPETYTSKGTLQVTRFKIFSNPLCDNVD